MATIGAERNGDGAGNQKLIRGTVRDSPVLQSDQAPTVGHQSMAQKLRFKDRGERQDIGTVSDQRVSIPSPPTPMQANTNKPSRLDGSEAMWCSGTCGNRSGRANLVSGHLNSYVAIKKGIRTLDGHRMFSKRLRFV